MAITLESLKKTVGKKKGKSRVFAWLADLERASGDLDGSLSRVNIGLQAFTSDLPGMLVRSRILFERGEFEDCIKECEKALKHDPLCLSAQKRMGDAYDQLGDIAERNKCYRRVHDMDPLDNFWKEEYETVLVEASDFVMPGLDVGGEESAASESSKSESSDDGLSFLTTGGDDSPLLFVKEESIDDEDEPAIEDTSSIFEKSTDSSSGLSSGSDSGSSIFSRSFDEGIGKNPLNEFSIDDDASPSIEEPVSSEAPAAEVEDDPFAALSALLPNDDDADNSAMDSLQESLDAAMAGFDSSDDSQEEFPADDNISGGDLSNVFANMFGDDSMEEDDSADVGSPFKNLNIPSEVAADSFSAKDVDANDVSLTNDSNLFGLMEKIESGNPAVEEIVQEQASVSSILSQDDKPQSVDSAFASIFGEDELPEENEAFTAKPASAPEPEPDLDQFKKLDEVFGGSDLFKAEPEGGFELGETQGTTPEPQPQVVQEPLKPKPVDDGPQSLDSAFASIFGDDELPEENPLSSAPGGSSDVLQESSPLESSVFEKSASESSMFEKSALESSPLGSPAFESSPLDSFAGLQEDSPQDSFVGLQEDVPQESLSEPQISSSSDFLSESLTPFEKSSGEPVADDASLSFEGEAAGSLNSIFGDDDDDLPVEKPALEDVSAIFNENPATPFVEPAESPMPLQQESLSEQVTKAEDELQLPPSVAGLEKEIGGAFNSIFGDDNSDLPSDDDNFDVPLSASQESTSAALEERVIPNAPDSSLESEVDGAFKGLFFTDDDDSLPESGNSGGAPAKGVDFLMSGDSDDEVSVGLIKDPSQPLSKSSVDIDESLNTRTLAEIYFEQGLYAKALDIYQDLCSKEPRNAEYQERLAQIEKIYRDKFGG